MRLLHHLWLTVYCKEEDNEEQILEKLLTFFPFDLKEEKITINKKTAIGFEEKKIIVIQVHLQKAKHLNASLRHLNQILTDEQKELLLRQKESRLDAEHHFFIRFDKPKLLSNNEYFITDDGNCFHLKMTIAAYPATRENSLKAVEEMFSNL